MKRIVLFSVATLLGLFAPAAWADDCGCASCGHGHSHCHCIQPPEEDCPDCSDPCCHRCPSPCSAAHAEKYIDCLSTSCDCHDRIKAVKKLGCRLHADFCACPEVLHAIVHALLCDPCWEVRQAAAWAIVGQNARVPEGIAALYISSKLDHHYLVRDAASDALSILILCRRSCYKDLFKQADELIWKFRKDYDPTHGCCIQCLPDFCQSCGCGGHAVAEGAPPVLPGGPEPIKAPKEGKPGEEMPNKKEPPKDDTSTTLPVEPQLN